MNKDIYTRAEYMRDAQHESTNSPEGEQAHRRYFGQFVTPGTKTRVLSAIGIDRLMKSTDYKNLNDIPLREWDALVPRLPGSGGFTRAGDYYTTANGVCLAKEAARQIIETNQTKEA